jgi:hypothetical protein
VVRALLLSLVGIALITGCDSVESVRVEEVRAKLAGTWLREIEVGDLKTRRVIVFGTDGKFTDRLVIATSGGPTERRELAGEWAYDGTNLKRKFLQENGHQFTGGSMRYATFPLVSVTQSELMVKDNFEGQVVRYLRSAEGTQQ